MTIFGDIAMLTDFLPAIISFAILLAAFFWAWISDVRAAQHFERSGRHQDMVESVAEMHAYD